VRIVKTVLEEERGNVTRTAARLGVDRNTIRRWLGKTDKGLGE
jgi:DNA-binding protein Fis